MQATKSSWQGLGKGQADKNWTRQSHSVMAKLTRIGERPSQAQAKLAWIGEKSGKARGKAKLARIGSQYIAKWNKTFTSTDRLISTGLLVKLVELVWIHRQALSFGRPQGFIKVCIKKISLVLVV